MAYSKTIYEIFSDIATNIGVNYDYGSFKEVQKRLIEKGKDSVQRTDKFPLMILTTPIVETRGTEQKYLATVNVNLTLVAETSKDYTTQERLTNIYKPVLYPLFDSLMAELTNMEYFDTNDYSRLEYTYTDFFYYSGSAAYEQNKLAYVLDAITIENLELNLLNQNCI